MAGEPPSRPLEREGAQHSADDRMRAVLEEFEGPLLRYAARITGDLDRARDAVQETFLTLVRRQPDRQANHLKGWLFKVCRNRAIDSLRKEKRLQPLPENGEDVVESRSLNPMQVLEFEETASQVFTIMKTLPEKQREALFLKFQDGLSYQEISETMNITVSNVGFLIHTALKNMRDRLRPRAGAAHRA